MVGLEEVLGGAADIKSPNEECAECAGTCDEEKEDAFTMPVPAGVADTKSPNEE